MQTLTPLDISKELKSLGFDEPCNFVYCKRTRVCDEIMKKYPNLSDDGYLDLLISNGGFLTEKELYKSYVETRHLVCRNSTIQTDDFSNYICACPSLWNAHRWLRLQHKIYICIDTDYKGHYANKVTRNEDDDIVIETERLSLQPSQIYVFDTYEDAWIDAIKKSINLIRANEKESNN